MARPKGTKDADYDLKRAALLDRMTMRVMRRETARPSFRQLADAAGVSVPTLRHYFGSRADVVGAIMQHYLSRGGQRLRAASEATAPFAESIHEFTRSLVAALTASSPIRLGDVFAVSLAEGLLDQEIGPSALRFVLDPSVDALQGRLTKHIERGEMRPCDTRPAALMLLSPILIAVLHQEQMGGRECNPADIPAMTTDVCEAFIRAYAMPQHQA